MGTPPAPGSHLEFALFTRAMRVAPREAVGLPPALPPVPPSASKSLLTLDQLVASVMTADGSLCGVDGGGGGGAGGGGGGAGGVVSEGAGSHSVALSVLVSPAGSAATYAARCTYEFPAWTATRHMKTAMHHVNEGRYPPGMGVYGDAAGPAQMPASAADGARGRPPASRAVSAAAADAVVAAVLSPAPLPDLDSCARARACANAFPYDPVCLARPQVRWAGPARRAGRCTGRGAAQRAGCLGRPRRARTGGSDAAHGLRAGRGRGRGRQWGGGGGWHGQRACARAADAQGAGRAGVLSARVRARAAYAFATRCSLGCIIVSFFHPASALPFLILFEFCMRAHAARAATAVVCVCLCIERAHAARAATAVSPLSRGWRWSRCGQTCAGCPGRRPRHVTESPRRRPALGRRGARGAAIPISISERRVG